jgi:hypothetical protein
MTKKNNAEATEVQTETPIETRADAPATVSYGNELVTVDALSANWGAIESMETTDILVPKIFHMQAMSKLVADGQARPGDFCDSLTGELLCKKEDKLEIIVFKLYKSMVVEVLDVMSNKYKLKEIVTVTKENAHFWAEKPYTESTESGDYKYNLLYNFYCLLPSKLNGLPYILTLGGKKTKTARKLGTMILKLGQIKRNGASVVFELESFPDKNDRGSWFGVEVEQGRDSTAIELMAAHAWYLKSKSKNIVEAGDDDSSEEY